jgi:hypothetical protein
LLGRRRIDHRREHVDRWRVDRRVSRGGRPTNEARGARGDLDDWLTGASPQFWSRQ